MNELPTELALGHLANFHPKRMALELAGVSIEEWKSVGSALGHCGGSVQWWIGDWKNHANQLEADSGILSEYAEEKLGEFGYSEETIRGCAYVCERIPIVLRRTELTWSHYKEIAGAPEEQRKHWIDSAIKNQWTVEKLREAMRKKGVLPAMSRGGALAGAFIWEAWFTSQGARLQRQLEKMPVSQWDEETILERIGAFRKMEKPLIEEANRRGLAV